MRLFAVQGPFVLSLWRHGMKGLTCATDVLEEFGLRGATRNWNTMVALNAKLPPIPLEIDRNAREPLF